MLRKRKKIVMSTLKFEDYNNLCKRIENEGIEIDKITFVTEHKRYDIHMTVTKEEAYKLFDLTTDYNAILWKGE